MIVEAFVTDRLRTLSVRAVVKEAELRQGPLYRFGARQVTALNGDRIDCQRKTDDCDRGQRSLTHTLGHQAEIISSFRRSSQYSRPGLAHQGANVRARS